MAGDKIRKDDIIEPGIFESIAQSVEVLLNSQKELETQTKSMLKTYKDLANATTVKDSKDLNNQIKLQKLANDELQFAEKLKREMAQTEKVLAQAQSARNNALKSNLGAEASFNKALQAEAKELAKVSNEALKANSVYYQTSQRYKELSNAQIELSVRGRENGKVFKGIKQEADLLRAALDKAEQGVGRFGRNVGNYSSGFNGLNNSVNQLTRELPALAINANTFFLAISNNLPTLFDNLSRINKENATLAASGNKPVSAFKQLTGAIFSLQTVLSVGITLLTLYGAKVAESIAGLFKQAEAFDLNKEALVAYNEELERTQRAQDDLDKSIGQLQKDFIKNANLISKEGEVQLNAIDKLGDSYLSNEKQRIKGVSKIVTELFKAGDQEVEIATRVNKNIIEIENKKTGEIIKLDAKAKKVQQTLASFFGKAQFTQNEAALQARLDVLNKETKAFEQKLDIEYNLAIDSENKKGEGTRKVRQKFSDEDFIQKRSELDKIRQLEIDVIENENEQKNQQITFDRDKALQEIEISNETEKRKLEIARKNRNIEVQTAKENAKVDSISQAQLKEDLIKIEADYQKEIKKIKADNISPEEQAKLIIAIERKANSEREKIIKAEKEKQDALILEDFKKTTEAREKIFIDNANEEIKITTDKYEKQKALGEFFDSDELNRQLDHLTELQKNLIQHLADERIAIAKNEQEKLAIQNEANIKKAELDKKGKDEKKKNVQDDIKQASQEAVKILDLTAKFEAEKSKLKQDALDRDIKETEKNIDIQRRLAEEGKANTFAFEQEEKAKAELAKKKEQDQELKRQKALLFMKSVSEYISQGKDPIQALGLAAVEVAAATAIAGAFYEGTEKVSDDLTGNKNIKDGYVVRVDGSERVMTGKQNEKVGDLSNEQLADLAYNYRTGLLDQQMIKIATTPNDNFSKNIQDSATLMQMVKVEKELIAVRQAIENRPHSNFEFTKHGDFITETVTNNNKRILKQISKKPRLG